MTLDFTYGYKDIYISMVSRMIIYAQLQSAKIFVI